jgi:hypothetical protein
LLGGLCRINSFTALWPLFGWWLLRTFPMGAILSTRLRYLAAGACGVVLAIALLAFAPPIGRALGAKEAHAISALQIFDLAGTTKYSGTNQFGRLPLPRSEFDDVRRISTCYNPVFWDPFDTGDWSTEWADPAAHNCSGLRRLLQDRGLFGSAELQRAWLSAIAEHPTAYARHRFAHLAASLKLFARSYLDFYSVPFIDPYGTMNALPLRTFFPAEVLRGADLWTPNWFTTWYFRAVRLSLGFVLFGPAEWLLVVAIGAAWATTRALRTDNAIAGIIWPLSMSAISYTAALAIVGVGFGTRYHIWLFLVFAMIFVMACASGIRMGTERLVARHL